MIWGIGRILLQYDRSYCLIQTAVFGGIPVVKFTEDVDL